LPRKPIGFLGKKVVTFIENEKENITNGDRIVPTAKEPAACKSGSGSDIAIRILV